MTTAATLLDRVGWGPAEAARRIGVGEGTVRDWRTGRRGMDDRIAAWLARVALAIEAVGAAPPPPGVGKRARNHSDTRSFP